MPIPNITTKAQDELIWIMYKDRNIEIKNIMDTFRISKSKLSKLVKLIKDGIKKNKVE